MYTPGFSFHHDFQRRPDPLVHRGEANRPDEHAVGRDHSRRGAVYNVIILLNFFRQLPRELSEAAYVDGASEMYILLKLYLPLSIPSLATLALFVAVGTEQLV